MANVQNLKDLMSFSGDCFGVGPVTFGTLKVARLKAWFEAKYDDELTAVGRSGNANANDFAALIFRRVAPNVVAWEEQQNIATQIAAGNITPNPMTGDDQ